MAEGSAPPHPRGGPPLASEPDACTACGACCFAREADYIEVFGHDLARMGALSRSFTISRGARRFMRFRQGRCTALAIGAGRARCRIYPERPDACRWLEPKSGSCREQLSQKREIALISLRRG